MLVNPLNMRSAALAYASNGWDVFPCRERGARAKQPYTNHGFKDASRDPAQIEAWWEAHPEAMIGLALPRGTVVIDIDPRGGGDRKALEQLVGGALPRTLEAQSGRGDGAHLWFSTKASNLSQKTKFLTGIDARIAGKGYVIAPPSLHPATGKPYRWLNDDDIAPLPRAIETFLAPRKAPPGSETDRIFRASVSPSIKVLVRRLLTAPETTRNNTLFEAGCRMAERELKGMSTDWQLLFEVAVHIGLPEAESEATLRSSKSQLGLEWTGTELK